MIEQYLKGLKVPKDELTAIERNKLLNEGKDVDANTPYPHKSGKLSFRGTMNNNSQIKEHTATSGS